MGCRFCCCRYFDRQWQLKICLRQLSQSNRLSRHSVPSHSNVAVLELFPRFRATLEMLQYTSNPLPNLVLFHLHSCCRKFFESPTSDVAMKRLPSKLWQYPRLLCDENHYAQIVCKYPPSSEEPSKWLLWSWVTERNERWLLLKSRCWVGGGPWFYYFDLSPLQNFPPLLPIIRSRCWCSSCHTIAFRSRCQILSLLLSILSICLWVCALCASSVSVCARDEVIAYVWHSSFFLRYYC